LKRIRQRDYYQRQLFVPEVGVPVRWQRDPGPEKGNNVGKKRKKRDAVEATQKKQAHPFCKKLVKPIEKGLEKRKTPVA